MLHASPHFVGILWSCDITQGLENTFGKKSASDEQLFKWPVWASRGQSLSLSKNGAIVAFSLAPARAGGISRENIPIVLPLKCSLGNFHFKSLRQCQDLDTLRSTVSMQNKKDERGKMGSSQNVKPCFLLFFLLLQTPIKRSFVEEPTSASSKLSCSKPDCLERAVSLHRRTADCEPGEVCVSVARSLARDSLSAKAGSGGC